LNRTERLAAITLYLLARRRVTAAEIAKAFEVSERTVYRDLQALAEGGLPLVALPGAGGGYELPPAYRLTPLTLTPDEAVAVWVAIEALSGPDHPLREAVRSAWLRIHAALPDELRRSIVDVGAAVDVSRMGPEVRVGQGVFAAVVRALRERRQLRIRYHVPATGETTERVVDVYGLACVQGRWYAPAYCHLRGDLRSFRLDRIEWAELLESGYLYPRDFDVRRWVQETFGMAGDAAERVTVRVRFSSRAARRAVDDRFFRGYLERLADGGMEARLSLPAPELPYCAELVLAYAGEAEALEPPELRDLVATLAQRVATRHAGPPVTDGGPARQPAAQPC